MNRRRSQIVSSGAGFGSSATIGFIPKVQSTAPQLLNNSNMFQDATNAVNVGPNATLLPNFGEAVDDSLRAEGRMKLIRAQAGGPFFSLIAVNGTLAAPTALAAGVNVGSMDWRGYDGAAVVQTAAIQVVTQTAWVAGVNADSRMEFRTRATGAGNAALAMTIDSAQTVTIGGTSGLVSSTSPLTINASSGLVRLNRFGANASAPAISFVKTRTAAVGSGALVAVAAADQLMALTANGIAGDNATIAQAGAYVVEVPTGGVAAGTVAGRHAFTTTNLAGANARRMLLTSEGTLIVGDAPLPGTNFTVGLAFGTLNGVDPTAGTSADLVHVYGSDRSAGNRAFSVFQEAAVAAIGGAADFEWPVRINGTNYMVQLRQA